MTHEQRRFSRLPLNFDASVEYESRVYSATVVDIALKGVLLEMQQSSCLLEAQCEIKIFLASDIVMRFQSQLVHIQGDRYGFVFQQEDLESITHLRRLLELNADRPQNVTAELAFLIDR
jgi:hypothetical protein